MNIIISSISNLRMKMREKQKYQFEIKEVEFKEDKMGGGGR